MITVTGRTFPHKDKIRSLGGRWNGDHERWEFDHLGTTALADLRSRVGLIVVEVAAPPPITHRALLARWTLSRHDDDYETPVCNTPILVGDDFEYYNHFVDQDPVSFHGFSSLHKFADHVANLPIPDNTGRTCDIGWTADPGYAGTKTLVDALTLARGGWIDGLGMMERLIAPEPVSKRRKRSVAGGAINVGRMLAGQPDHMVKRTRLRDRRIITLFVETVMWQGITVNTAIVRVVLIAAMIDRLESEGYACNIIAVYCGLRRDAKASNQLTVRIKDAGERLSVADVSFAFGHPSFGRRLVYAAKGVLPQCDMTHDVRGIISQAFDDDHRPRRNEFYIPQIRSNIADMWEMLDMIQPDDLPVKLRSDI